MVIELDGFAILRSIGSHAGIFRDVAVEAKKSARTLVVKQLKTKSAGLASIRDICGALGSDTLTLLIDGMTDAEVKSILGKLDKHHPDFKMSNAVWRRQQLCAIARGTVDPTPKAKSPRKPKRDAVTSGETQGHGRLSSAAMSAVRKRRT